MLEPSLTSKSDPNCAQNHKESIIYTSESAKASMTTAYHSYKLENLHPFCEYDFIVSTQIEPKNKYETLNATRFISSGVQAKGKLYYDTVCGFKPFCPPEQFPGSCRNTH